MNCIRYTLVFECKNANSLLLQATVIGIRITSFLGAKFEILQDHFVRNLGLTANTTMVDVAGGTGDIAFRAVREIQSK